MYPPKMYACNVIIMYSIYSKSTSSHSISWHTTVPFFLQSIQNIIPFAILKSSNTIDILATSISTIDNMEFDYDMLVRLAQCISKQILYMEKKRMTFIGFELSDILSVGGKYFIIANCSHLVSYDTRLTIPFVKPTFTSPEITGLIKLPAYISPLTTRYSLGALIMALLGGSSVKYTKLYWFLERCKSFSPHFAIV